MSSTHYESDVELVDIIADAFNIACDAHRCQPLATLAGLRSHSQISQARSGLVQIKLLPFVRLSRALCRRGDATLARVGTDGPFMPTLTDAEAPDGNLSREACSITEHMGVMLSVWSGASDAELRKHSAELRRQLNTIDREIEARSRRRMRLVA